MPIARSHDALRVENFRADELPGIPDAAVTVPDRDPVTGRFVRGNTASRRRRLKRIARQLPWLDTEKCADWIRPYIEGAKQHALDLLADLPAGGAMTSPMAEELATARLVYRALLALGMAGDRKALAESRAWLRESRQHALALEGIGRSLAAQDDGDDDLAARRRAFQRALAERSQTAQGPTGPAVDAEAHEHPSTPTAGEGGDGGP